MEAQAKAAGMQSDALKSSTADVAKSKQLEQVHDKLEEIDAKIKALSEAVKSKDVVIKTWYESE